MTEQEALNRLTMMVQASESPALTGGELADLFEMAKVADSEDRAPSDDEWEPTFELERAAAEGWRRKAGKVAGRFGVTLDGETLHRQQIYAHCLKQADDYAKRIIGSIGVKPLRVVTEAEFQVEA